MKLSPRMIQAMEILQLPMLALQERIEAELMSNPVLELRTPGIDDEAPPAREDSPEDRGEHDMVVKDNNDQGEDFQRLAEFTDEYGMEFINSDTPSRRRPDTGLSDRKMEAMANAPAHEQSLNEYLMDQWRFVETDGPTRRAGDLEIIEEPVVLADVAVELACPGQVRSVECVPQGEAVVFEQRGQYVRFVLPRLVGHQAVCVSMRT